MTTPSVDAAHANVGPETLGKNHLHVGLDRKPEGRADDARHAVREPGADGSRHARHDARPPKILDWLPWNHVFGGSHNFNMMLANGGSLYIDEGKPTKGRLRGVSPKHPGPRRKI